MLSSLVGKHGWLSCTRFSVSALDTEDHVIFTGITDDGELLDETQCRRFFDLPGEEGQKTEVPANIQVKLAEATTRRQQEVLDEIASKNGQWFEIEMDKLDRWAEDRRTALKAELDELDQQMKEMKKAARLAPTLPVKLERQRALRKLETRRDEAWRNYDDASRAIDRQKDALLDEISHRLGQKTEQTTLFTLRSARVRKREVLQYGYDTGI